MKINQLLTLIDPSRKLPGWNAQAKMASPIRRNYTYDEVKDIARLASVIVLFYEKNGEVVFPLNKRHKYDGVHSDQIGLPGGSIDHTDQSPQEAALRETEEELSIPRDAIKIVRPLSQIFVPPSKFLVSPFIGYIDYVPHIIKDDTEVKEVIEVRVKDILDKRNQKKSTIYINGFPLVVPSYVIKEDIIWGATAMILSELASLIKK